MLFPANTQLSVFLSLDTGHFFDLESVKIKIDGDLVTTYLYQDQELQALKKGGIHKIYIGNISDGDHQLTAIFNGAGPRGREYQRATSARINKSRGPKYIELAIVDSGAEVVATGNPGCMMQIGAGLRMIGSDVGVVHPIELVDESYRRGGLYP